MKRIFTLALVLVLGLSMSAQKLSTTAINPKAVKSYKVASDQKGAKGGLNEDFEGTVFLPLMWSETATSRHFQVTDTSEFAIQGMKSALLVQNSTKPEEMLISPKLILDGSITNFSFKAIDINGSYGFGNANIQVKYSADGTTWTNVGALIQLTDSLVNTFTIDLSTIANGNYYLALAVNSTFNHSPYASLTVIDSIVGPAISFEHAKDLRVADATSKFIETDSSIFPTVTLGNYGSDTATDFAVTVKVIHSGVEVYASTKTYTGDSLAPLKTMVVTMDSLFTPDFIGVDTIVAFVTLAGDEDTSNDTLTFDSAIGYGIFTGDLSTEGGLFYDNGGPFADYDVNKVDTMTVYPDSANMMMSVHFSSISLEEDWDYLYVYNNNAATPATLVATFTGSLTDTTITAKNEDGALTFIFASDEAVVDAGWEAEFACIPVYTVTFTVTDGTDSLENASIVVDGRTLTTDSIGQVAVDFMNGTYSAITNLSGYFADTTDFTVANTTSAVNITLTEIPTYAVTFTVTNGTDSLGNAKIVIGTDTLTTDSIGRVSADFENGTYTAYTTLSGYNKDTTVFTVADSTLAVNITLSVVASIKEFNANVVISPNPTSGLIKITADNNYSVEVFDINGRKLTSVEMEGNTSIIDITSYNSGMYIVRLSNNEGSVSYKVIKK